MSTSLATLDALTIALCIGCQFFMVGGQLMLKKAMNAAPASPGRRDYRRLRFVIGITALATWFFLWLGILQQHELSRVFVFEGLNPALLSVAAWLILKERLSPTTWVGILFICGGITLAATS